MRAARLAGSIGVLTVIVKPRGGPDMGVFLDSLPRTG